MNKHLTNGELIKILGKQVPEDDQKALDFFMNIMEDNKNNGTKKIKDIEESLSEDQYQLFSFGYNVFVFLAKLIETQRQKQSNNQNTSVPLN